MKKINLEKKAWWSYLEHDLQELMRQSIYLVDTVGNWTEKFHDYSFVVFPAAKAYEGFLKKLFLDSGFIDSNDYFGKSFRIGKALNPHLDKRFRDEESVYDKVTEFCGGVELADFLWETWKNSRNILFHWFPNEVNAISFEEATDRINQIVTAMDTAVRECNIK